MVQPKKASPIETISGKNPILLIAPHGRKEDDTNSGKLARLMAERLNCYAVINEYYERPKITNPKTGKKKAGRASPKKKLFDLNNLTHVRKYLEVEFLRPIIDYTITIHRDHGTPLVILIHGIKDKRIKNFYGSTPNIVMGIGLPDNLSCVELFAECLKDLLPEAVFSDETLPKKSDNYSGRLPKNLNQLFTDSHSDFSGINFDVQSIQLEIKFTDFRDKKNIENTSERLSVALAELLGIVLPEQAKGEEQAKEVAILPKETQPDTTLVDKAYLTLADIFTRHYENALLEAGHYIINEFYDGNIKLVKAGQPTKGHSLNQLIKRFQGREQGSPSRSWVFNAVNMVIDEEDFGAVQTYGQLKLSHKINLLPIKDEKQKAQLIEETITKGYTIRQLKERISKLPAKKQRTKTIQGIINKPGLLFSPDYSAQIKSKSLAKLSPEAITKLRTRAQEQKEKIKNEVAKQSSFITKYTNLIQALDKADKKQSEN